MSREMAWLSKPLPVPCCALLASGGPAGFVTPLTGEEAQAPGSSGPSHLVLFLLYHPQCQPPAPQNTELRGGRCGHLAGPALPDPHPTQD